MSRPVLEAGSSSGTSALTDFLLGSQPKLHAIVFWTTCFFPLTIGQRPNLVLVAARIF